MQTPIVRYSIPRWILDRSWALLRQDGLKEVESTVLWGGRRFGSEAVIMAVTYPCGRDVAFRRGFLQVGADTTAEMGRWLRQQGMRGLIQVHTHPGGWTGHSDTDNDFPIASSDGFVSLVWPHFAAAPVQSVHDLGIHQLRQGRWRHVKGAEAEQLIHIVESEAMVWAPPEANGPSAAQLRGGNRQHE